MFTSAIKTTTVASSSEFRHRAGNCILITIAVVCVCVLVACGVIIVREYVLSSSYIEAECRVTNITDRKTYLSCSHCSVKKKSKEKGKGACAVSSFPCIQIHVSYQHDGRTRNGVLHPDSLATRGKYKQVHQRHHDVIPE